MKNELILESFKVSGCDKDIKLVACDEGYVFLSTPTGGYQLIYNGIEDILDEGFLLLEVSEGSKSNMLFPVPDDKYLEVDSFLKHWDGENLQALKDKKVKSFLDYGKKVLKFIEENIDVAKMKPTYRTEYVDNTDYGGGVSTYVYIDLSWGESWEDDFEKSHVLTSMLTSQLIDEHFDCKDDYLWFSKIIVMFEPKAKNICDFIKI